MGCFTRKISELVTELCILVFHPSFSTKSLLSYLKNMLGNLDFPLYELVFLSAYG